MRTVVVVAMLAAGTLVASADPAVPGPALPGAPVDPGSPPDPNRPTPELPKPPTPAEQAFLDGRVLLDDGKHAEACAKFEESIKLDPEAPGTLLNLGLCNMRLGKTATALFWFRKAQFRSAETNMTDYEDVAKNETFQLAVRVPKIKITFAAPPPAGGAVFVDDKEVAAIELGRVELDPGTHRVELRVTGKPPIAVDVTVKDGDDTVVEIPVPRPPPAKPAPPRAVDHGKGQRLAAYVIAGGGIGLWTASALVTLSAKSSLDATELPHERARYRDVARYGGTSLFVGGTLALVAATYLYVTAPGVEYVVEQRTAVAPVVGTDQLGVMVHGAF